jgi:hypothetical protein
MENVASEDVRADPGRKEVVAPPYVSFSTVKNLLDWLGSEGVPLRLDRSFWQGKYSGSTGTQLMAALRFLGLLQGDRPMPDLESLVEATTGDRRFILKELLKDSYGAVPFEELERATPAMLRGWFRAYPIGGHTLRKAISFFVHAAREAEMPMSNAVRKMAKSKVTSAPAGAARERRTARPGPASPVPRQRTGGLRPSLQGREHSQTTIALQSGGVVTVGLAVDLFELSDRDREFVLALVDLAQGYQDGLADVPGGGGGASDG